MIWRPYKRIKTLEGEVKWHEDANLRLDEANVFLMREKARMTGALAECEFRYRIAQEKVEKIGRE